MGIRDWLAIIVIIFIVLILLDGFRRKWQERKTRIRVKLDKNIPPPADGDDDNDVIVRSELPGGGARTKPRVSEEVPVLMDTVDIDSDEIEGYSTTEEDWEDWEDWEDREDREEWEDGDEEQAREDISGAYDDDDTQYPEDVDEEEDSEEDIEPAEVTARPAKETGRTGALKHQREDRIEPTFGDADLTFGRDDQGELNLDHHDLFEQEETGNGGDPADQVPPEQVLIINVMAKSGATIEGGRLLPVLMKCGMRLGDMSIFHRHADSTGKGPVMFSMANMLKPGTFDISAMETFTTPGVCFFMQLPNKLGNMQCFEQMLKTAQAVKDELDAILKDENRSVFTRQTLEHSRQRIRDFELEMLARK